MTRVKRRGGAGVKALIGLYTWCGRHGVIVKPSAKVAGQWVFGSDADHCSHRDCERLVIKKRAIYERVEP